MGKILSKPGLAALLRRILSRPPQKSGEFSDDRAAFQQALCKAAGAGLLPAVEKRLDELRAAGFAFKVFPGPQQPHFRQWTLPLDDPRYVAELQVLAYPDMQSAHLTYRDAPRKVRRTRAHRLQEAFYARYDGLWDRLRNHPRARIGVEDRRVLLVGDLEADVNNGGFNQYLDNKGRRKAQLALAALHEIGAVRTARMLEEALRNSADEGVLERLTNSFYEAPEDLAALAARHAKLG